MPCSTDRVRWLILGFIAAACSSSDAGTGALVVGVQADDLGGLASSMHWVVRQDGAVIADATGAAAATPEIALHGAPGARVDVEASALGPTGATVVTQTASSLLVDGGKKLLRVHLAGACVGVVCPATQTCSAGACVGSTVATSDLEDYATGWAGAPPDVCRPAQHGVPSVVLGLGQTDYGTLNDGQTVSLEKGTQGGHHFWIAVRMKNLRQTGTTTSVHATLEGDATPVPPTAVVFGYVPDEGAFCKVWGIRYQVDVGADLATGYKRFLGKRLDVTVDVADSTGAKASSTRMIMIADLLLCPDGTHDC